MHRTLLMLASLGGIGVALLGSLCYIGPLIFVAFGGIVKSCGSRVIRRRPSARWYPVARPALHP
jgi:hypothetical protein